MQYLRQSTASQEISLGYFVDATDGNTEETGLTIANTDIKLLKSGATSFTSKNSGGATHVEHGVYSAVLDATDTDTIGPMTIYCHVAGALTVKVECVVLSALVYDAMFSASSAQILTPAPSELDSNIALMSLNEAKQYLKVTGTESDVIISILINATSNIITGYVGRNLLSTTYTEYYDGDGSEEIILRNSPIISVTSLNVDADRVWGSDTSVDVSSNIIIYKQHGIIRAFNLDSNWEVGNANIKIVYVAGYALASIPYDIRLAAKRILDFHWRTGYTQRRLDISSESISDRTVTYQTGDIPEDAKKMLDPYKSRYPCPHFSYAD